MKRYSTPLIIWEMQIIPHGDTISQSSGWQKIFFDEFMEQTVHLCIPGSNLSLAVKVEGKNTLAQ